MALVGEGKCFELFVFPLALPVDPACGAVWLLHPRSLCPSLCSRFVKAVEDAELFLRLLAARLEALPDQVRRDKGFAQGR